MSYVYSGSVQNELDKGFIFIMPLVKMEIPGQTLAYYNGPYDFDYNGTTYEACRWLEAEELVENLSPDLGELKIRFSNILVSGDPIETIETLNYTNAPVTIYRLIVDPELGPVDGLIGEAKSSFHKIEQINYTESEIDENGEFTLNLIVTLGTPGVITSKALHTQRSDAQQKYDNNNDDLFFTDSSSTEMKQILWGTGRAKTKKGRGDGGNDDGTTESF